jgi:hypothetical protein
MNKFGNKYRNESIRLKNRDYGAPGFYFVTIYTLHREIYFGHIDWDKNVCWVNPPGNNTEIQNPAGTQNH